MPTSISPKFRIRDRAANTGIDVQEVRADAETIDAALTQGTIKRTFRNSILTYQSLKLNHSLNQALCLADDKS
jgi:hypothetical protein